MNSLTLPTAPRRSLVVAGATLTALVSTAAWVAQRAQSARSQNPPAGNVVNVDDTQVHYLERGHGTPLVLLHGNTLRLEDFVASGLVERLARNYRVLAFDRPGFGYSERPRNRLDSRGAGCSSGSGPVTAWRGASDRTRSFVGNPRCPGAGADSQRRRSKVGVDFWLLLRYAST